MDNCIHLARPVDTFAIHAPVFMCLHAECQEWKGML